LREPELFASPAVGVGHCDDEDALSSVRSSDVGSLDDPRVGREAKFSEVGGNSVQPARNERANVFEDHIPGANLAEDAGNFFPEPRLRPVEARASSSDGKVLAGEAGAHEVDGGGMRKRSDVIVPRHVGPVFRQHRSAEWIDFALPDYGTEPSPFEAEL
jgi:hypothetical protein